MQYTMTLEWDMNTIAGVSSGGSAATDGLRAGAAFCDEMGDGYECEKVSEAPDKSAVTVCVTFPGDSPRFTHEASAAWDRALYNSGVRRRAEPQA